ncbi:DNA methyltransferase [Campylobacter helveticus]|uniref:DNA methyltransferase n=3 Tax=Campylobacter helveticus TaxID=28898 RepID=UPI0022EAC5D0|nr:site-specific DNA-methyltransferase [Campylobacter helveticus]
MKEILTKELKEQYKREFEDLLEKGIIEEGNVKFLQKLIDKAEDNTEAIFIKALATRYKRTGFHFDVRLEKTQDEMIKYFEKDEKLSFDNGGVTHRLIIGDNYPALLNLLITHRNKIKVIYIDPPYSKDAMGKYAQTNYDNAITRDNLLSMLFTRLSLAKELLREDGVIFCSIDDRNQAYVKGLFDEVFGEGNFVANLCVELSTTQGMKVAAAQKGQIVKNAEYILCYAKNVENFSFQRPLYTAKEWDDHYSVYIDPETKKRTTLLEFLKNKYPSITKQKIKELYNGDKDFRDYIHANAKDVYRDAMIDINFNFTKKQEEAIENGDIVSYKEYLIFKTTTGIIRQLLPLEKAIGETDDFESTFGLRKIRGDWWEGYYKDMMNINKEGDVIFKNGKKPKRLIKDLLKLATTPANNGGGGGNSPHSLNYEPEIILDFFAGSGTTAHAVMELNREDGGKRQCILVTNNEENIAHDVTAKRLKRIMSGECYDGSKNFKWCEKNEPYKDSLEVLNIKEIADNDEKIFKEIDERLYGKNFSNIHDKIEWVCENFEKTCVREKEKEEND